MAFISEIIHIINTGIYEYCTLIVSISLFFISDLFHEVIINVIINLISVSEFNESENYVMIIRTILSENKEINLGYQAKVFIHLP